MSWPWYVNLAALALVLVAPVLLGRGLARRWRMPDYTFKFVFILFTLFAGVVISYYGWATDHIQLGIDLKGGSYLVYQVMDSGAVEANQPVAGQRTAATPGQLDAQRMDNLVASLRRRLDPSGVLGVKIRGYGSRQVEIKVPQVDPQQVASLKRKIAEVGTLEFRILATDLRTSSPNHKALIQAAKALPLDQTQLWDSGGGESPRLLAWWVPVTEKKEEEFLRDPHLGTRWVTDRNGKKTLQVLVVNDDQNVTGEYLTRAAPGADQQGRPAVTFTFNSTGAAKFGRLTGFYSPDKEQNFEYHLGIILDKKLFTAPNLKSAIFDRGQISGDFDDARVRELVDVLNAGALPATLSPDPISERTTGPELGQDTIKAGKLSIIVALGLVFIGVLFYYRFAGIVACIALAMNAVLLLACMIIINAEFSLAGIAGFALSVAMAVDANVLIYERMREEAGRGAGLRMTIRNGFERALSAIIDSNLTTLITAVILYAIGSDQVRGFAVTLFLGIVLSMYTAIIVARVIFNVAERRHWIDRVKMLRALPPTHFNFLRYKWPMISVSLTLITIGLVATFVRGRGILDIDFTGGVSVEAVFNGNPDIGDIRKRLASGPEADRLSDVTVRNVRGQRGVASATTTFIIDTSSPAKETAEEYRRDRQEKLEDIFGSQLTHNHMTFTAAPIPPEGAVPSPNPGPGSSPSVPSTGSSPSVPAPDPGSVPSPNPADGAVSLVPSPASGQGLTSSVPSPASGEGAGVRVFARPELIGLSTALLGQTPDAAKPSSDGKTPDAKPASEGAKADAVPATKDAAAPAEKPAPEKPATEKPAAPGVGEPSGPKSPTPTASLPKPAVEPFAGGTKATLTFEQPIDYATVENLFTTVLQAQLKDKTGTVPLELSNPDFKEGSLGRFPTWEVKIKLPPAEAEPIFQGVAKELQAMPFFPSLDTIGKEVAGQTSTRALFALAASTFFILLYLWVRFQRIAYGIGAVASLIHDVLIALSFVAMSYYLAPVLGFLMVEPFKINVIMMTSFLTLAGYSLNDTIVIFDRIREIRGKAPQVTEEMINVGINQCLGRTLLTGLVSIMVILTLYILGGPTIHGFAFAMTVGVITGMYSSVYIAAPFLLWVSRRAENR